MKKNQKFGIVSMIIMLCMFFVAPASAAITAITGASAFVSIPSAVGLNVLLGKFTSSWSIQQSNIVKLGVIPEYWLKDIVESIFKTNVFLKYSVDDTAQVMNGSIVHIPQGGAPSAVVRNRTVFPATVTDRTDTDITYTLDHFSTDPRRVSNLDKVQLSYDKRNSVIKEDKAVLNENIAEAIMYSWAPATATTLRTTGANVTARVPGQTLTRKQFVEADLMAAMTVFNAQGIPQEGRYCMMDAYMYDDFIKSLSATTNKDFSKYYDAEKGIVGKLHSFNIIMRQTTLVYNAAATTLKAYNAAVAATDCTAALCWHESQVRSALGSTVMNEDVKSATMYGDVISFEVRIGGSRNRADGRGVLAISQVA